MIKRSKDEYCIGIFGSKNSGKTVYLTAVYCRNDQSGVHVGAADDSGDPTHVYMKNAYSRLLNSQWPDATALGAPHELRFQLTSNGVRRKVLLPDIAGELTQRKAASSAVDEETNEQFRSDLKDALMADYESFDAFMIFAPSDIEESDVLEHHWEISVLLDVLQKRSSKEDKIQRPVAVIVSKWDKIGRSESIQDNQVSSEAEAFFAKNYSQTQQSLDATCGCVKVFPVSSTGPCLDKLPPRKLEPFGVTAPLCWLLESADQSELKRADDFFDGHESKLFAKDDNKETFFDRSKARYDTILAKSNDKTVRNRAEERLRDLDVIRRQRTTKRTAITLGCILATIATLWFGIDYWAYSNAKHAIDSAELSYESMPDALAKVKNYRDSLHPLGNLVELSATLQKDALEKTSDWEQREYRKIEDSWKQMKPADSDVPLANVENLVSDCKRFVDRFPVSEKVTNVKEIGSTAEEQIAIVENRKRMATIDGKMKSLADMDSVSIAEVLRTIDEVLQARVGLEIADYELLAEKQQRLRTAKANLDDRIKLQDFKAIYDKFADDPIQRLVTALDWLSKNPDASSEVLMMLDDVKKRADEATWSEVLAFVRLQPTNFYGQIAKLNLYLNNENFSEHKSDGKKLLDQLLSRWDKQLYEELRIASDAARSGSQLAAVEKRCSDYLNTLADNRPATMQKEVEAWRDWYIAIQEGMELPVELKAVTVNKNSRWHGYLYYPTVKVTAKVGDKEDSSGIKNLGIGVRTTDFPEDILGPFSVKLSDKQRVAISITCTDFLDETLPPRVLEGAYACQLLNGVIEFDDGKIIVELECPKAVVPELPVYRSEK